MPAPVLVVHDEADARESILTALRGAGHGAVGFGDPLDALDAMEIDTRVRVLVTRLDFGVGKLNGLALARMVRHKRRSVKGVFVGRPENGRFVDEAGEFFPHPIDCQALVEVVGRHLAEQGDSG